MQVQVGHATRGQVVLHTMALVDPHILGQGGLVTLDRVDLNILVLEVQHMTVLEVRDTLDLVALHTAVPVARHMMARVDVVILVRAVLVIQVQEAREEIVRVFAVSKEFTHNNRVNSDC